jgi:hypothetical protein
MDVSELCSASSNDVPQNISPLTAAIKRADSGFCPEQNS